MKSILVKEKKNPLAWSMSIVHFEALLSQGMNRMVQMVDSDIATNGGSYDLALVSLLVILPRIRYLAASVFCNFSQRLVSPYHVAG